jgi:hypothetical protein
MAFLMIRIEVPGDSVADMNSVILNGDSTKPQAIMNNLIDLVSGISSRNPGATVDLAVRETTESISADGDGETATCSLL